MSLDDRRSLCRSRQRRPGGWTLVELLVIVAIVGTLSALLIPAGLQHLQRTTVRRVILDLNKLQFEISAFEKLQGRYPTDLDELESGSHIDRWGNPYQYLPRTDMGWKGKARKDRFMVPLNSDFDLYSMGPDGLTASPLTARDSRDDIVRANDGRYIGPASDF